MHCVANMPGSVPQTSSEALNNATLHTYWLWLITGLPPLTRPASSRPEYFWRQDNARGSGWLAQMRFDFAAIYLCWFMTLLPKLGPFGPYTKRGTATEHWQIKRPGLNFTDFAHILVCVRGHSSAGRAPALQAGGRRFDPSAPPFFQTCHVS